MNDYEEFANLLKKSKKIAFFGGAGVSTSSGLKDYRSKDGIYNSINKYGLPPEEILSHDFLMHNSKTFYKFFREYFFVDVKPSVPHLALKELEDKGYDVTIVTQNIDGLHTAAGSSMVFELHGNSSRFLCCNCEKKFDRAYVEKFGEDVPYCSGCGGFVRPNVVMYGEMLYDFDLVMAADAIEKADMLIVAGTSLQVWPAAGMVDRYKGDKLIVMNKQPISADRKARMVFREDIATVFTETMKYL